jgi:hypothetical protein
MSSKIRENAAHRLVVEGRDDQWTVINLMSKHGWDWNNPEPFHPFLHAAGNVNELLQSIGTELRTRTRTGFVLDADVSLPDRWTAVRDQFVKAGFQPPTSPASDGTILEHRGRRAGVWLMPDNQSVGKLEDFLARLIPSGDSCWPRAQQSAATAKANHGAPFADKDRIKAELHTWLAWRENPGQPFGTAITAATFDHDAVLAATFVAWMNRLFRDS